MRSAARSARPPGRRSRPRSPSLPTTSRRMAAAWSSTRPNARPPPTCATPAAAPHMLSRSSRAWPRAPACRSSRCSCPTAARSSPPRAGRRRAPLAPSGRRRRAAGRRLHRGGRRLAGPPHRRSQHGLVRGRRPQERALRSDRARRHPLLAFAGAAYLPMVGMNSHGIGNVSNSMHSTDNRVGVPNAFVRRWTMEAATLEAARERGLPAAAPGAPTSSSPTPPGGCGTSSPRPRRAPWPTTARAATWPTPTTTSLPTMAPFEGSHDEESRTRLRTAETMLAAGLAAARSRSAWWPRVLRCHEPSPDDCICGHPDPGLPRPSRA